MIKEPVSTNVISVSTDLLPTLAELTQQQLPERPYDGISLVPFFTDPNKKRDQPLGFWQFEPGKVFGGEAKPYIDPILQEGTTPLKKMMAGKFTRSFRNNIYSQISENDYSGERALFINNYKLVVEGQSPNQEGYELYDIYLDPAERKNLADDYPDLVRTMREELRAWQESVLRSLTGADY